MASPPPDVMELLVKNCSAAPEDRLSAVEANKLLTLKRKLEPAVWRNYVLEGRIERQRRLQAPPKQPAKPKVEEKERPARTPSPPSPPPQPSQPAPPSPARASSPTRYLAARRSKAGVLSLCQLEPLKWVDRHCVLVQDRLLVYASARGAAGEPMLRAAMGDYTVEMGPSTTAVVPQAATDALHSFQLVPLEGSDAPPLYFSTTSWVNRTEWFTELSLAASAAGAATHLLPSTLPELPPDVLGSPMVASPTPDAATPEAAEEAAPPTPTMTTASVLLEAHPLVSPPSVVDSDDGSPPTRTSYVPVPHMHTEPPPTDDHDSSPANVYEPYVPLSLIQVEEWKEHLREPPPPTKTPTGPWQPAIDVTRATAATRAREKLRRREGTASGNGHSRSTSAIRPPKSRMEAYHRALGIDLHLAEAAEEDVAASWPPEPAPHPITASGARSRPRPQSRSQSRSKSASRASNWGGATVSPYVPAPLVDNRTHRRDWGVRPKQRPPPPEAHQPVDVHIGPVRQRDRSNSYVRAAGVDAPVNVDLSNHRATAADMRAARGVTDGGRRKGVRPPSVGYRGHTQSAVHVVAGPVKQRDRSNSYVRAAGVDAPVNVDAHRSRASVADMYFSRQVTDGGRRKGVPPPNGATPQRRRRQQAPRSVSPPGYRPRGAPSELASPTTLTEHLEALKAAARSVTEGLSAPASPVSSSGSQPEAAPQPSPQATPPATPSAELAALRAELADTQAALADTQATLCDVEGALVEERARHDAHREAYTREQDAHNQTRDELFALHNAMAQLRSKQAPAPLPPSAVAATRTAASGLRSTLAALRLDFQHHCGAMSAVLAAGRRRVQPAVAAPPTAHACAPTGFSLRSTALFVASGGSHADGSWRVMRSTAGAHAVRLTDDAAGSRLFPFHRVFQPPDAMVDVAADVVGDAIVPHVLSGGRACVVVAGHGSVDALLDPNGMVVSACAQLFAAAYASGAPTDSMVTVTAVAVLPTGDTQDLLALSSKAARSPSADAMAVRVSGVSDVARLCSVTRGLPTGEVAPHCVFTLRVGGGASTGVLSFVGLPVASAVDMSQAAHTTTSGALFGHRVPPAATSHLRQARDAAALTHVLTSLRDGASHVPYRSSPLTQAVKPALDGDSRVAIVCTVPTVASTSAAAAGRGAVLQFGSEMFKLGSEPSTPRGGSRTPRQSRLPKAVLAAGSPAAAPPPSPPKAQPAPASQWPSGRSLAARPGPTPSRLPPRTRSKSVVRGGGVSSPA